MPDTYGGNGQSKLQPKSGCTTQRFKTIGSMINVEKTIGSNDIKRIECSARMVNDWGCLNHISTTFFKEHHSAVVV